MYLESQYQVRFSALSPGEASVFTYMNSINNLRKAIDFEIKRQLKALAAGEEILVETRTFDAASGQTLGMRFKETMNDYRYFPDPDLSPVLLTEEYLQEVKAALPVLPAEWRSKFLKEYQLPAYDVALLTEEQETAVFFDALCRHTSHFKAAANWMNGPVKGWLNDTGCRIEQSGLSAEQLAGLIQIVEEGKVSFSMASQRILPKLPDSQETALELARLMNLIMEGDESALLAMIEEVLLFLPEKVKAYRKGKKGLMGLFMGELMKKSQGKADPEKLQILLQKALNKKE